MTKRPIARKTTSHNDPIVGSGVLCTGIQRDRDKIACLGVFTTFWAWAYPCMRQGHALVTVFNLPSGKTTATLSIGRSRKRGMPILSSATIEAKEDNTNVTFSIPFTHRFHDDGIHNVIIELKDYGHRLVIPVELRSKRWPKLTKQELAFAHDHADLMPKLQANVVCHGCKHIYVFEEPLHAEAPIRGGALPFPANGTYECLECGREIPLRDLQGQLLATLKESIRRQLEGAA